MPATKVKPASVTSLSVATTPNAPAVKTAQAKSAEYAEALKDFYAFREQNEELFVEMERHFARLNAAAADAKIAIKEIRRVDTFTMGHFRHSKPKVRRNYRAEDLPARVLKTPGVVKTVDVKKIQELILSGELSGKTAAKAEASRTDTFGSVSGHKELNLTP